VAVVQISKIQVRRGQKLQGTGLPQLSSGELGWAVDTRELFIGNGAVSEGAPAVGNTKILTEYDDLFALADTYTYKADEPYIVTGTNSSNSIKRSLQQRLDDFVTARAFGVKFDGATDDTAALQRAIDQLFLNDATKGSVGSRVVLVLDAGTCLISDTIYVPPYATIIGAGKDKTVIRQTVNKPAFITVNSTSTPGSPASDSTSAFENQATNIFLKGMTVDTTAAGAGGANNINSAVGTPDTGKALILESCRDSLFEDIIFKGVWTSGSPNAQDNGVVINCLSGATKSRNNTFNRCRFEGFGAAVRSKWDIDNNIWNECEFDTLGWGFVFGFGMTIGQPASGQSVGPNNNLITNSEFNNIKENAIWIENGEYNASEGNRYTLVGTNGGPETNPIYPVIKYNKNKNKSYRDYFARTAAISYGTGANTVPYIPEIEGSGMFELSYENAIRFGQLTNIRLFRLPAIVNQAFKIDYTMVSETYRMIRSGTLHVVVDAYGENVEISDEYHFTGDETYAEAIEFAVQLQDMDNDLTTETIDVKVTSVMPPDDETEFKYTVTTKRTNVI
jgi:hypothetical protein